jgi:predicted PurR-regulated permease PerM
LNPEPQSAVREIFGVLWTWIKGQILIWLIDTVLYLVGFAIARAPLWPLLAILCGIGNAIPHFGPILGLLLVALFSFFGSGGDPWKIAAPLAVWVVVQLAEGFYIGPKLLGRKLGLSPWLVIFGGIAGGLLGGPIGMLIATPVLAVATVIWRRTRSR